MSDELAPEGLAATLADAGLRLGGPLGAGARGPVWAAVAPDGSRWAVAVLTVRSATHGARLERRAAQLAAVDHEHLARVVGAVPLPDGRLAVLHRAVAGTDLAAMLAARPRWAPGEVVTVLVPLAGALAALHAAGLAHGDVAPANVVLSEGRPVLVDLLTGDDPLELGTPGYAAPERAHGADAPSDVHALARLGLALLGAGGHPGGADAGGGRDEGRWVEDADDREVGGDGAAREDGAARATLVALLASVRDAPPRERVDAATLAADVYAACAAAPVRPVDPAVLARLSLRRLAGDDGVRTRPTPARARGRHRRPRRRTPAVLVGAALVALVGVGVVVRPALAGAVGGATGGHAGAATAAVAPVDLPPAVAAVRLTAHRARALLAGDAARLASVTVPGSRAAAADRRALARLGATTPGTTASGPGEHPVPLVVVSHLALDRPGVPDGAPSPLGPPPGATCRDIVLAVAVRAGDVGAGGVDRAVVDPAVDGGDGLPTDAGAVPPLRLTLCGTRSGWRVAEVAPAADAVPETAAP